MASSNYAIYGIIVYWLLSAGPHFYALYLISKANNWNYNNLRPWAPEQVAGLKSSVGEATWAKYEKLEALSKNSFENFPLFIAAVILGTISARNFDQFDCLNLLVGVILILRVIYATAYITAKTQGASWVRTISWLLSVAVMLLIVSRTGDRLFMVKFVFY